MTITNKFDGLFPGLLVAMVLAFWWPLLLSAPGNVFDESMLLVAPDLVLHGKVAYRDFGTYYGPGNLWVLAGAYKLAGVSFLVERTVGIFYRLGYLAVLSAVCWRMAPRWTGLVVLVAIGVTLPLSLMAMAWFPAVFLGLYAVLVASKTMGEFNQNPLKKLRIGFLAGLILGLALVFRPDTAPAAFLGLLPIFWVWRWEIRFRFAWGLALGLLPLAVQAWVASPCQIWNNLFYHPVILSSPARTLPLVSAPSGVQWLVGITVALCLLNIGSAFWWRFSKKSTPNDLLFLSASLFGAGLTHQLLQRCDPWHVAMGMMVTAPLGILTLHRWLQPFLRKKKIFLIFGAAGIVFLAGMAWPVEFKREVFAQQTKKLLPRTSYPVTFGQRTFPTSNPIMRDRVIGLLRFMESASQPGQTVFVGPGDLRRTQINDIFLYYLLMPRLQPGSYYIELNPLVANAENSGLATDLKSCDWVILNLAWDGVREPNRSRDLGSEKPVQVLQASFTQVFRDGPFVVYRKN